MEIRPKIIEKSLPDIIKNVQNLMLSMEQSNQNSCFEGITFIAPFNQQGTTHFRTLHPMGMFWPQWQWCIPQISAVPGVWMTCEPLVG